MVEEQWQALGHGRVCSSVVHRLGKNRHEPQPAAILALMSPRTASPRLALLLVAIGTAFAASRPPLAGLAGSARSAPPEFAADALLRIASSATAPAWKRTLIEDAFQLAASAQEPFARRNWSPSESFPVDIAYAQGLDTCTLQCRAVHAMLALDRKKARELFAAIPPPRLPRLTCEDTLVPDVSILYATAAEIAAQSFTPQEAARDEPLHFLQRYAADLASPLQAAPVARMLAASPLPSAPFEALVASFAASLKQLSGDDRSFSATIAADTDSAAIEAVAAECARKQISALPLLEAWRAYLVRHLGGSRCADTSGNGPAVSGGLATSGPPPNLSFAGSQGAVRFFNDRMLAAGLQPISPDEARPSQTGGKAVPAAPCDSPQCRQIASQLAGLLLGPNGIAYKPEEQAGAEWGGKLLQYLAALADWRDDDNPAELFQWKSRLYSDLFNTAPAGPQRDLILSALLTFLQQNSYQRDHRLEWFYPVNALIIRAFADPLGMKTTMRDLHDSTDPVIALYASLEQALPRPLDATIGFLH